MTIMLTAAAVDDVIDTFFAERLERAGALGGHYERLWRTAQEASEGGKRVRPRLVLETHHAFAGTNDAAAVTVAAAFELLHTGLLLHDDVIDGDVVRRGRPNLAGAFAAEATAAGISAPAAAGWGEASAILAGDLLISAAHTLVARLDVPQRSELLEIIDESVFLAAAGEHADVAFSTGVSHAPPEALLLMMEHKTANYSFAAPLRTGAVLAGAGAAAGRELGAIGRRLGLVFQLRDDMLGVFGTEARTGKSTQGDLREGKRTFLVAQAEHHPAWAAVRHLFGHPRLDDDGAQRLRAALVTSGAHDAIESLISQWHHELLLTIARSPLPEALQTTLARLATHCAERDA